MCRSQQITSFVGYQSLIVVVGIVAATYNLFGDGETFREGIVYHFSIFIRIDVHVASVTSAEEGTDGTVFQVSSPSQLSLDVHFYRLEVEVDEMRIYECTFLFLCWQIENVNVIARRIVLPVDGIG